MAERDDIARVRITAEQMGLPGDAGVADVAVALLGQQQDTWEMLRTNYAGLSQVQTRHFRINGCPIRVQFNPGRLTSSTAKVDDRSISERRCFLCLPHLPPAQRGVLYRERFMLLCNPFPILPEHFTVPNCDHVPQRIAEECGTFLTLARDVAPRYSVFYNGPRCGASAPDHMHFQAGTRQSMPIEGQYARLRSEHGTRMHAVGTTSLTAVDGGGRRFVVFEGTDPADVERAVRRYLQVLGKITGETDEPKVNIIAWYDAGTWTVLVFPREKHRPSFFFAEGDERLLISPAAVDIGGLVTVPIEADFRKITHDHLVRMFEEVMLSRSEFTASVGEEMKSEG